MEELVNKLAMLQAEQRAEEKKADEVSALTVELIADAKKVVAAFEADYTRERSPYVKAAQELETTINDIKQKIIDEWDGKKKTLNYLAGTVSFRQTGSLRIIDDVRLMELLIEKATVFDVVSKYIRGFKLTGVKKFVEVHNVQTGVASMEYKTTVSLKTE